ncbi:MAG: pirin family protein [Gammaproteobacteria bacterium]|jgi:redox-sensitive bicupin YhaK (pirin superfamily)|nr:pirin family protein [Gammaproteobacteria bacterium]MDH3862569.1 pirin family protein [Gammaproteobacteria bacterium]MDH3905584.1 pirin family protein [Gammaproteobacteria bacterium]MDH3908894.1 pirin family protein [Gammaproteobacteria bacterium]MDH4004010.1 pirin family protein [Gammaproteobacteria bacterium]
MSSNSVIDLLIEPKTRDLGEFTVRRSLPDKRRQRVGPFIFFDHMGPAEFQPGTGVNVRAHPHIGLATITYLFEGEILHRDSLGYVQPIRPGAVNWMTAGKGIVHSEKVTEEVLASGQRLHGLQIWLALPLEAEEIEPTFQHYPAADIPDVTVDGAVVRVVLGAAFGVSSPVATQSETLYVEVILEAGQSIDIPVAEELAVYVVEGSVAINEEFVDAGVLAVLESGASGRVAADTQARIMFAGGDALTGERIIWWNFVSSSRERLERAKEDWREKRFDAVPGETDFIPLPER